MLTCLYIHIHVHKYSQLILIGDVKMGKRLGIGVSN
jgi:hypothetical protein